MCLTRLIYRGICDGLFIGTLELVPVKKVTFSSSPEAYRFLMTAYKFLGRLHYTYIHRYENTIMKSIIIYN